MLNSHKQPKPPVLKDSEPFDLFIVIVFCLLAAFTVKYYADYIDCGTDTCVKCADNCLEPAE